jgi:hypothetical protein
MTIIEHENLISLDDDEMDAIRYMAHYGKIEAQKLFKETNERKYAFWVILFEKMNSKFMEFVDKKIRMGTWRGDVLIKKWEGEINE